MLATVIRRQNDDTIVDIFSSRLSVNGSLLDVPADNLAFFIKNGEVSEPYPPGRWTINTGVGPFFVRFRHLMTGGDPGITVQVVFVNVNLINNCVGGTGEILFEESRFRVTMHAKAAYNVRFSIPKPRLFLAKMVGLHRNYFNDESLQPSMDALILPLIKKAVGSSLSTQRIQTIQNDMPAIGSQVATRLREIFHGYGMQLEDLAITGINVPSEDIKKLNELELKFANGKIETDLERYNLDTVYGGKLDNRTRTEFLTNTARGPAQFPPHGIHPINGMVAPIVSLPVRGEEIARGISELMPSVANLYGRNRTTPSRTGDGAERRGNTGNVPLPTQNLPNQYHRCPSCGCLVDYSSGFCRYCGHAME